MASHRQLCTSLGIALLVLSASVSAVLAETIIGDWEAGSADGWIDWGNGLLVTDGGQPAGKYTFSGTTGVTLNSSSLHLNRAGYQQNLAIKLQDIGAIPAFLANTALVFDVTYPAQSLSAGYSQIYEVALNAQGHAFAGMTSNPVPGSGVGYGGPTGDQTLTVTIPYGQFLNANGGDIAASPGWVEFIFSTNNGNGSDHPDMYFDKVRLVPEPSTFVLAALAVAPLLWAGRRRRK